MHITDEMLAEKNACSAGRAWFCGAFPAGAELQAALDRAVADNHEDYADWLLDNFRATDTEMRVDGDLVVEGSLYFAGRVIVSGEILIAKRIRSGRGIKAGEGIKAGRGIEAGWGIEAGEGIEAGLGIKAGEGIEAGDDFGIFAGLRVRLSMLSEYGCVIAKKRPSNLCHGEFVEIEE